MMSFQEQKYKTS